MSQRGSLSEAMGALADGERKAFDRVFDGLKPLVERFCAKMLGPGEHEDAAQDVLMKIFAQASRYRPGTSVEAWALTIAGWECRTRLKRRARSRESVGEAEPSTSDLPEELERTLLREALNATLGTLSPDDQQIITTSVMEDRPLTATERKRKQRALTRFREVWRRLYEY